MILAGPGSVHYTCFPYYSGPLGASSWPGKWIVGGRYGLQATQIPELFVGGRLHLVYAGHYGTDFFP